MTFEQLAAWLAGGLAQPVDDDALREAITAVLPDVREDSHWKGQGPATDTHVGDRDLQAAAERIGEAIVAAMKTGESSATASS